jgi:hypothetical protein
MHIYTSVNVEDRQATSSVAAIVTEMESCSDLGNTALQCGVTNAEGAWTT